MGTCCPPMDIDDTGGINNKVIPGFVFVIRWHHHPRGQVLKSNTACAAHNLYQQQPTTSSRRHGSLLLPMAAILLVSCAPTQPRYLDDLAHNNRVLSILTSW
jgi:hypothetical protein